MFEFGANRHSWSLTIAIGATFVCSLLAAFGIWQGTLGITATVLAGLSLALRLRTRATWDRERQRHGAGETTGDDAACADTAPERNAGRVATDASHEKAADDAVRLCYEMAARVSHAHYVSTKATREIGRGIEAIRDIFKGLRVVVARSGEGVTRNGWEGDSGRGGVARQTVAQANAARQRDTLGAMLEEITTAVREMAEVLRGIDHNAKELITSTEETTYSMSRLDSFLQDMANSGRDLEASTDTANRVALEGTKVVGEMGRENEAIITAVKEAACAVEDLGRWSQEVGKIVEVIRDIADETNLLALNAAIIAAQSGEHGKAFGVVAEEIRGLAERTSSSTKEISDLVSAVQENTANVVKSMKKSLQRVERGELLTRNAGMVLEKVFESFESSRHLAKQIATSTFEHKIDSSHVVRSLHKVADLARRIEAPNLAKWAAAGETLATARVLKAVSGVGVGAGTDAGAALGTGASLGTGLSPADGSCTGGGTEPDGVREMPGAGALSQSDLTGAATASQSAEGAVGEAGYGSDALAERLKSDIGSSIVLLNGVRRQLAGLTEVLGSAAGAIRAAARRLPAEAGPGETARCWEITGCGEELRQRCAAYMQDDWRCFLTDGVACMRDGSDSMHGQRKCHECVAFVNNMGTRVPNLVDSER